MPLIGDPDKDATEGTAAAVENMDLKENDKSNKDDYDDILPELMRDRGAAAAAEGGSDDDTSSVDSFGDANGGVSSTEDADALLLEAATLKDQGNTHFKEQQLDDAARCYRRGTNKVKKLNKNNAGDDQVKALLISLQTNLSMVSFKQGKYRVSGSVATKVLEIDATNVKALYRRAVANRKTGDTEKCLKDLRAAAKLDPKNIAVKKELVAAKKELEQAKQSQKKALQKAFGGKSGGSSFLYNDKEAALKRKEEEREEVRKEAVEFEKKRKLQWEDEVVKRMANSEPAVSFVEWQKEEKDKQEAVRKELDEAEEQNEKDRRVAREESRKARESSKNDDSDADSDDELTAQELASLRGYKKTADGRTTSYFNRELTEDAKQKIGDIAPKRLSEMSSSTPVSGSLKSEGASAWNQAGTWEEKDTTTWCTTQLRKRLEATSVNDAMDADIVSVEVLTGDASVAIAGGKRRYIFDYHAKLKYEIKDSDEKLVASGVVGLPDICSTSHEELDVTFESWTKAPSKAVEEQAIASRLLLSDALRATIQQWVVDFNEMY